MGQKITQVDSFTNTAFAGNPAGVCILEAPRDERWMQNVAREMNLAETAFLLRQADGFDLRWFTPVVEVDLCGHATLASAHVLWEEDHLPAGEQARFHTRSGLLTAERQGEWITMNFPATLPEQADPPSGLVETLGLDPRSIQYTGKSRFDYLVEVDSEETVRAIQPNFTRLATIEARGVIVTARAVTQGEQEYDFVSRFFAPLVGVNEDPVTGSAHCCLSPFWSQKLGRNELVGYQASTRGGIVRVRLAGDRVYLSGQAVTVLRGELV
ncbi:MAG: PhzF family phenazine biosynthesis protein [Ktedonobacteraceae bacterium]|nr:PhzF family phenazine biosynthesis protein [Ktedonobacteraceae bacterium]